MQLQKNSIAKIFLIYKYLQVCEYEWKNACSLSPFKTDIKQSEAAKDFTIYLKFYLFLLAQICRRVIIVIGEKGGLNSF